MKESVRSNTSGTRDLLISKHWVQAVAIVVLFGFFVLGLLAYRTYTDQAPIPGKVVRPEGQVLFTRADVIAGQEIFLRNGLMEYGSIRPWRLPGTRFHGGLPAPLGAPCSERLQRLALGIRES
jgi:hypothetical protein